MGKKRPFLPRLNSSFFAFSNSSRVYFLPSIHIDLTPTGNSKNIKRLFIVKIKLKKVDRIPRNDMDSCVNCGTYVSKDLAVKKGKNIYCSEKCSK